MRMAVGIVLLVVSTLWLAACVQYYARFWEIAIGIAVWAAGLFMLALAVAPR